MLHSPPTITAGLATSLEPISTRWNPSLMMPGQPWQVELVHPLELGETELAAWQDLMRGSACENPFLSPQFVLPACRNLESASPLMLVMRRADTWCGVGLFEAVGPHYRLPVPYLRTWRTRHTFLQGLLLRRGEEAGALASFWEYMQHGEHSWHAVEFTALAHDMPEYSWLHQSALEAGVESLTRHVHSRAFLQRTTAGCGNEAGLPSATAVVSSEAGQHASQVDRGVSRRRARSLRQSKNWLQRQGGVELRFQRDPTAIADSVERFLELESMGWKGEAETSLLSRPADEQFFREMVHGFQAEGQLFFVELLVGGEVMGSVVHLQVGNSSYAFKLGWNPQFARGGPGFQLKAFTEREIFQAFPELERVDSCACPGSFIEHLWPDRRTCSSNLFMTSRAGVIAGSVVGALRWIRDCGRRLLPWRADPSVKELPLPEELPEHCTPPEEGTD